MRARVDNAPHRTFSGPVSLGTSEVTFLLASWFVAASFMFFLSGQLGVRAGTALTARVDVLFSSDLSNRTHNLAGVSNATEELREHRYSVSHPLLNQVWGTVGAGLTRMLSPFLGNGAPIVASRLLVAVVAGLGWALTAVVARRYSFSTTHALGVLLVGLLFTSNVLVAVPEHYGLSSGLLASAFAVTVLDVPRSRLLLIILTLLTAATTITNAVFPAACLAYMEARRLPRDKLASFARGIAIAGVVLGCLGVAALAVSGKLDNLRHGDTIVTQFWNVRFFTDPSGALLLAPAALIYPVIGPAPTLVGPVGLQGLSYEPVHFGGFSLSQVAGLLAWIGMFSLCFRDAFKGGQTRSFVWLCMGWIVFNVAFHSVWGDEFFLYSPHWAFAIAGVVALGVRGRSLRLFALLAALTVSAQVVALYEIVDTVRVLG